MLYHKFNREVMFGDKFLYYLANYTLQYSFERKIIKLIKNKKKLVVFDVGCYRGIFVKTILNLIGKRKYKFYLFEINRKAKKYLENILKLKNIYYNEIALCNKNGTANYNYNRFFESAGSSLSNVVKNDTRWNFSRKLIMKILLRSPNSFVKYIEEFLYPHQAHHPYLNMVLLLIIHIARDKYGYFQMLESVNLI